MHCWLCVLIWWLPGTLHGNVESSQFDGGALVLAALGLSAHVMGQESSPGFPAAPEERAMLLSFACYWLLLHCAHAAGWKKAASELKWSRLAFLTQQSVGWLTQPKCVLPCPVKQLETVLLCWMEQLVSPIRLDCCSTYEFPYYQSALPRSTQSIQWWVILE